MDKWVPHSLVKKNFGKISTAIEGVYKIYIIIVEFDKSFNAN